MPRKKPIRTIADLAVSLERKRKKFGRQFERALKLPDAVRAATVRFQAGLSSSEPVFALKTQGDFRMLVIEEYERLRYSRRPLAQRHNARSTAKKRHFIGQEFCLSREKNAFHYRVPITLLKFAEDAARRRLVAGDAADKLVWEDLAVQLRKFDPKAYFAGKTLRKQSIVFRLNGQSDSISWYAFERVVKRAHRPEATIGQLSPN